jgi:hypothetical protein
MDPKKLMVISALVTMTPGCRAIADIFKAGVWVGVVVVVLVMALVAGIIRLVAR